MKYIITVQVFFHLIFNIKKSCGIFPINASFLLCLLAILFGGCYSENKASKYHFQNGRQIHAYSHYPTTGNSRGAGPVFYRL